MALPQLRFERTLISYISEASDFSGGTRDHMTTGASTTSSDVSEVYLGLTTLPIHYNYI